MKRPWLWQNSCNTMRLLTILIAALLISGPVDNNRAREANRAYEAGEYQRAEALYREILQQSPDNTQILFNLGNALARQGKIEESAEVFDRYRREVTDPVERAPAEYNLGHLHGETGNTDEAITHFRQALDLDPEDEDAKFNYELLKRRQQQSPEEDQEDEDQEEQEQDQQPEGGEPPPGSDDGREQEDDTGQEPLPAREETPSEEQPQDVRPEISREQLDHAEDLMNALEQIEKDLIRDFKRRQHDPVDPHEKDW